MSKEVLVTGIGLVTAAGDLRATLESLLAGRGRLGPLPSGRWPSATVPGTSLRWPKASRWQDLRKFAGRSSQLSLTAAADALASASLTSEGIAGARCGTVAVSEYDATYQLEHLGPVVAGEDQRPVAQRIYEDLPDFYVLRTLPALSAQFVSLLSGFSTQALAVTMPAMGGFAGLSTALRLIEGDELDAAIVTAAAPFPPPEVHAAIDRTEPLGTHAQAGCGPFGSRRAGTFVGEGAAALVLETPEIARRRGAVPLARLLCCETATGRTPQESLECIRFAALDGREAPQAVFAHGAASVAADALEARVLLARAPALVTATKGCFGNLLGAGGLADLVLAAACLRDGVMPPVVLLGSPDASLGPLKLVAERPASVAHGGPALVVALDGHHGPGAGAVLIAAPT